MKVVYSYTAFGNGACCYVSGADGERGQRFASECLWFVGDCWDVIESSDARPDANGRPINGTRRLSAVAMRNARADLPPYDEDAAVRWVAEGVLPSDDPLDGGKERG